MKKDDVMKAAVRFFEAHINDEARMLFLKSCGACWSKEETKALAALVVSDQQRHVPGFYSVAMHKSSYNEMLLTAYNMTYTSMSKEAGAVLRVLISKEHHEAFEEAVKKVFGTEEAARTEMPFFGRIDNFYEDSESVSTESETAFEKKLRKILCCKCLRTAFISASVLILAASIYFH